MKQTSSSIIKITLASATISFATLGAAATGAASGSAVGAMILLYIGVFAGLVAVTSVVVAGVSLLVMAGRGWIQRFSKCNVDDYAHGRLARGF